MMRRWFGWRRAGEAAAIAALLAAAAFPFVVLFPDPPAFGHEAATLLAAVPVVAAAATAVRAGSAARGRILRRAGLVFAVSALALVARMLLHGGVPALPTPDLLPRLFCLHGEDVDDAVSFEAWLELWLGCAAAVFLPAWWWRRPAPVLPPPGPWGPPAVDPPWNAATVLLWLVGWGFLAASAVQGHQVAAFLSHAERAVGTIDDESAHPRIRFTAADGRVVTFVQNGGVSRPLGAAIPVAYALADPAGTAQADTPWGNWTTTGVFAWIGLGFTLFPFFGMRAQFGRR